MPVHFAWWNAAQTALCYRLEGNWNWQEFHTCVRASLFTLHQHPHTIMVIVDWRGSTRPNPPSGITSHIRTFGKKQTPAHSGNAIVIGLPATVAQALAFSAERTLSVVDGVLYSVDDDEAANALLAQHNLR
jgi:hypothetical protein